MPRMTEYIQRLSESGVKTLMLLEEKGYGLTRAQIVEGIRRPDMSDNEYQMMIASIKMWGLAIQKGRAKGARYIISERGKAFLAVLKSREGRPEDEGRVIA